MGKKIRVWMFLSFFLILALLFPALVNCINNVQGWQKTYGGIESEIPCGIVEAEDGGYMLAGTADGNKILLIKTDAEGNIIWSKNYEDKVTTNGREISMATAETLIRVSDGCYLVTGSCRGGADSVYTDALLLKIDSSGKEIWHNKYGKSGLREKACDIIETPDGFVMVGSRNTNSWIAKIDKDGSLIWSRDYDSIEQPDEEAEKVFLVEDGYVIYSHGTGLYVGIIKPNEPIAVPDTDAFFKVDFAGNVLFNVTFQGNYPNYLGAARLLCNTSDKGFIFAEWNGLFKTNSLGKLIWNYTINDPASHHHFSSAIERSDGTIVSIGYLHESTSIEYISLFIMEASNSGHENWEVAYDSEDAYFVSLVQAYDGGLAVIGVDESSENQKQDFWLLKTNTLGVLSSPSPSPIKSVTPNRTSIPNISPSPSIPEFFSWTILTLIAAVSAILATLKRKKSHNKMLT